MERGTLIAGKYELRERLGRGGMGEVWAGRDRDLHRNVAIKLLVRDDDASPDLFHRFEREAVAAAQINHPNVVSLYDRGIHDGLQFLVMEHIDGNTLGRHMHEQAPMPPARALEITQEICAALVAAHRAKVVHYDIKPSNIMLTADDRIKVVDFGIAGFTHTHTFTVVPTSMLAPVGTALYGAPEQFLDQRGDERSDLYALGGVLFALLTGKPPFGDGNPLSIIRRKLDDEPPPLRSLRPDVPESVAQLLTDLLQRDPDRRPQTASVVYERLEQLRSAVTTSGAGAGEPDTERLPRTAPTRALTHEAPDTEDAFEIAWTGQEPISTYVTHNRRPLVRHWLLFTILALPLLYVGTGVTVVMISEGEPVEDLLIPICLFVVYAILLHVMYGRKLWAAALNWRRHRHALKDRNPWSLRVDAAGITTTDPRHATPVGGPAGHRTFRWSLATAVTLEHAAEFRWGPSYAALHVQPEGKGTRINSISPAGMVHPRSPQGKAGRWPLCALGPMTQQQHEALIAALARHAGSRWKPELGEGASRSMAQHAA
ncbi:serine/threonine-protein kinase [Actinomadura alba]|uniref:non-specific serine/threonine protein kinase n=1 Tax=Actinomadura alba TaxID=406431 RepID=A0ABR7LX10_9ACTN|nr:serine/threonine-protein kinase [Actinomadura alba]MBC6469397.1 serine/threonine protein kinase [Actinomadura alba]